MTLAEKEFIYLYCVTSKVPKLKEAENIVKKPCFIYHRGIFAVVNRVKENEFGEENLKKNLADLEWLEIKATLHEKLIEEIMKYTGVIPFKFATLFNTEDNLKVMLAEYAQDFREKLDDLRNKEEWGVKVYCDMDKLKGNLMRQEERMLEIDKNVVCSSAGKAYILRKKKEELLNELANSKLNEYGQASFEKLREQSHRAQINKLLPREVTERKSDMILNAAFLVEKNKISDFMRELSNLKAQYENAGLFFDCTGPWPPYNFCSIQTKCQSPSCAR